MLTKKIIIHNFSLSNVTIRWNYYKPTLIHSHVRVFRKVLDVANISCHEPVLKLFHFYFPGIYKLIAKIGHLEPVYPHQLQNKVVEI